MTLKNDLSKELTKGEMESLKTAFDVIGDIAILEIDEELSKKEKLIADHLLSIHKNLKVVCKKSGRHEGVFRTQDLIVVAGESRKETITKENSIQLKLDVEKVYFSPRLSTERKRISEQVMPNEHVLVMFSGCGPYPLVLLRKEPTLEIISIEMNPVGIIYQKENLKLNRKIIKKQTYDSKPFLDAQMRRRIRVLEGDVRKVVPTLHEGIFGVKSSLDEAMSRVLDHKKETHHHEFHLHNEIDFIEIHLFEGDLEKRFDKIVEVCNSLNEKGIDVILHQPEKMFGKTITMMTESKDEMNGFLVMLSNFEKLNALMPNLIGFVVHPSDGISHVDIGVLIKNIEVLKYSRVFDKLYFENMTSDMYLEKHIKEIAKHTKVCVDLNHLYSVYKDPIKIFEFVEEMKDVGCYYHISDSIGDLFEKSNRIVGDGKLLFDRMAEHINFGCVSCHCEDYNYPRELLQSYRNFLKYKPAKFDRILMPLPKTADEFLPSALSVAKKGTIIHFYDFLNENDFYLAQEKIEKACKKQGMAYQIIEIVKCGQHAPHVFRICVDFMII